MDFILFSGVFLALFPGVLCEYKFRYGGMVAAAIFAALFLIAVVVMWLVVGLWRSYYEKLQLKRGRVRVPRTPKLKRKKRLLYSTVSTPTTAHKGRPDIVMHDVTPRGEHKADIWAQNIQMNRFEEKSKTIELGEEDGVSQHQAPLQTTQVLSGGEGTTYVLQSGGSSARHKSSGERTTYLRQSGDGSARYEYRTTQQPGTSGEQTATYIVQGDDAKVDYRATGHQFTSGGEHAYVFQSDSARQTPDYRATHHAGVPMDEHTTYIKMDTEAMRQTYAGAASHTTRSETYAGAASHTTTSEPYHVHASRMTSSGETDDIMIAPTVSPLASTTIRMDATTEDGAVIVFGDEDIEVETFNKRGDITVKEEDMVQL